MTQYIYIVATDLEKLMEMEHSWEGGGVIHRSWKDERTLLIVKWLNCEGFYRLVNWDYDSERYGVKIQLETVLNHCTTLTIFSPGGSKRDSLWSNMRNVNQIKALAVFLTLQIKSKHWQCS
jgi:hypothetical protein